MDLSFNTNKVLYGGAAVATILALYLQYKNGKGKTVTSPTITSYSVPSISGIPSQNASVTNTPSANPLDSSPTSIALRFGIQDAKNISTDENVTNKASDSFSSNYSNKGGNSMVYQNANNYAHSGTTSGGGGGKLNVFGLFSIGGGGGSTGSDTTVSSSSTNSSNSNNYQNSSQTAKANSYDKSYQNRTQTTSGNTISVDSSISSSNPKIIEDFINSFKGLLGKAS